MISKIIRAGVLAAVLLGAAGCTDQAVKEFTANAYTSFSPALIAEMGRKGMTRESPILGRIFKEENRMEIWKQTSSGRYDIIASYEICKYSGQLGPKFTEGDRQAPEGFYTVRPAQMNPNSRYTLAFNMGYPNAYDRANGRTGTNLMVHGACSSSGCYSMTDPQMKQIFAFAAEAFKGGQTEFQIQAFPFRMTAQNMARYRNDPNFAFWKMLKEGYDEFEITRTPPKVDVCEKRYVFNRKLSDGTKLSATGACPAADMSLKTSAYQDYQKKYDSAFASALRGRGPAAKPSIVGMDEAKLVADWSKRRARGERITVDPPDMAADGKVSVTPVMGRATNEAGRRMAAKEAAEAEKKRLAEEKLAAELAEKQRKAAEKAAVELAKAEAAKPKPATAEATTVANETTAAVNPQTAAEQPPAGQPNMLKRMTGRLGSLFGN